MPESGPAIQRVYPRQVKAKDGRRITLRLMEASDADEMLAFARSLPPDDLLFLRRDITLPEVVNQWVRDLEEGRTITVLSEDDGKLAGYGALHFNEVLWTGHVGEIRMLVAPDYRQLGLGSRLASELFAVAKDLGLKKIMVQMTPDQQGARVTFERLGFRPEAILADFVLDRDGKTRDLLIMSYDITGLTDVEDVIKDRL
jgi:RimJ/RimL family protein N-acetyltransferase